jgi:putative transcriptional regulator
MTTRVYNNVYALRTKLGFTQEAMCKKIGISRQTLSKIELGTYNPTLGLAFTIAKFFEKPIEKVFSTKRF